MILKIIKYTYGDLEVLANEGYPSSSKMSLRHWSSSRTKQLDHHFCQFGF